MTTPEAHPSRRARRTWTIKNLVNNTTSFRQQVAANTGIMPKCGLGVKVEGLGN